MRGDKFGKIDFGQMLERVRRVQIQYDGIIAEFKRLHSKRRMAGAVDAGVAAIRILVLFMRGARTVVRVGNFRSRDLIVSCCHMVLHGMGAFMHAIDRDGQHDQEENPGKEL